MTSQQHTELENVFENAGLPEVNASDLPHGQYTNQEITRMVGDEEALKKMLQELPPSFSPAEKREVLSIAAHMLQQDKILSWYAA